MKSTMYDALNGGSTKLRPDTASIRYKSVDWRCGDWPRYEEVSRRIAEDRKRHLANVKPQPRSIIALADKDLGAVASNLQFSAAERPVVSIIVPVFNNLRLTLECLTSIRKFTDEVIPYEVIVADDASTDATPDMLPLVRNVIYLRNDKNLGFLRNCNRAAERTRGEFVVFLNNDVQVTAGWLPALVDAFRKLPKAGAVGPRMIYPSGHLQEAGVVINPDCRTEFIGHNDDPTLPCYSFARRVDYCSGACLMVERARFVSLGGFNDALAPAYFEDVDLCMRLRRQGLDVWYVPEAVVIHHRNKTSATLGDDYAARLGVQNHQKIVKLWQADVDALNRVRLFAFYPLQLPPIPSSNSRWRDFISHWTRVVRLWKPIETGRPVRLVMARSLQLFNLARQVAFAQRAGIDGLCFRYDSSAKTRLSAQSLETMFSCKAPDFPFLLCWTTGGGVQWPGTLDNELPTAQQHAAADDTAAIRNMIRYFSDRRYVRIDGKPLLLVDGVNLLSDFARIAATWRSHCRKEGIGEIYLAMVQAFDQRTSPALPAEFGCDAVVRLPPSHGERFGAHDETPNAYETSLLVDLRQPLPAAPCFTTVMSCSEIVGPRPCRTAHFSGASPGAFQAWLEAAVRRTKEHNFGDERIVFIDA